jgi:hypothetical protein
MIVGWMRFMVPHACGFLVNRWGRYTSSMEFAPLIFLLILLEIIGCCFCGILLKEFLFLFDECFSLFTFVIVF